MKRRLANLNEIIDEPTYTLCVPKVYLGMSPYLATPLSLLMTEALPSRSLFPRVRSYDEKTRLLEVT